MTPPLSGEKTGDIQKNMEFGYLADVDVRELACLSGEHFSAEVQARVEQDYRLCALFGVPEANSGRTELFAVLCREKDGSLCALRSRALSAYPAITSACPQAHRFEREIHEQWDIAPEGHPWLKPIRFHRSYADPSRKRPLPGECVYFRTDGPQVHEVAVGPVHAGVIEPGHFRFQCFGEEVLHLEISLGFQHRGIERALAGGPDKRAMHFVECAAGDTSIGHAFAHCTLLETLHGARPAPRGQTLRRIALELERLANHTGDLGAMAGDVGYLPTLSYCGRIRGDFLNMTAMLCGNRFGRGLLCPGGTAKDADSALLDLLSARLADAHKDARGAVDLSLASDGVRERYEGCGTITKAAARALGLVGPPARACGLPADARHAFPVPDAAAADIPLCLHDSGDVYGRALVRSRELDASVRFVAHAARDLPQGETFCPLPAGLPPHRLAVGLIEGWRGEICHAAITDGEGRFRAYKIVDPSFHNWSGLALALRGEQISDFPLCNKSFNLSYCGHDL